MNGKSLSNEELNALGLSESQLGEAFAIPELPDDAAHGTSLMKVTIAAVMIGGPDVPAFIDVRIPDALGSGVEVARASKEFLQFRFPLGESLRVMSSTPLPVEAVALDRIDKAVIGFDARKLGGILTVVLRPNREGLLVDGRGETLTVRHIGPAERNSVAAISELTSPVMDWCADLDDSWLVDQIQRRVRVGTTWSYVAATALYGRLMRPANARRADIVSALRSEASHPFLEAAARPAEWFRKRSVAERADIEDLALARVERLSHVIEVLENEKDTNSDGFREDLLYLCHAREELEGVRALLQPGQQPDDLGSALRQLDRAGIALTAQLDGEVDLDDPMLQRVFAADSLAWWAAAGSASTIELEE